MYLLVCLWCGRTVGRAGYGHVITKFSPMGTARGNVTRIGSQRMQGRKMVPVLKITIALIICSIFVECRKVKVFCVICEIGLKAYKSQIVHNFARFVVHE